MTVKNFVSGLIVCCLTMWVSVAHAADVLIYDFPMKKSQWQYHQEGDARATLKSSDSKLFLNILRSPAGAFNEIQLYMLGFKLDKGQKYNLQMNASSNSEAEISCKFHKASPNWESYQDPEYVIFELSPGENSRKEEFISDKSSDSARLSCYFGQNRGDTNIVINSLQLFKVNAPMNTK